MMCQFMARQFLHRPFPSSLLVSLFTATMFMATMLLPATYAAQDSFPQRGAAPAAQVPQQPPPQGYPSQSYPPQGSQPQGYPPQGASQQTYPPPQQAYIPADPARMDQLMAAERQDYGVAPVNQLHSGAMHGPTPASIPGGQVITTKGLTALMQGQQTPYLLFDVLGGPEVIPGANPAAWLAQPGAFNDGISGQFAQLLQQATQGRKDTPLIFYCLSTQCWMSYNASLRAINLGFTNVLWYRGGIEAWKSAGLPVAAAQQGYSPQPGYPSQPGSPQQPAYPSQPGYPGQPQQPAIR